MLDRVALSWVLSYNKERLLPNTKHGTTNWRGFSWMKRKVLSLCDAVVSVIIPANLRPLYAVDDHGQPQHICCYDGKGGCDNRHCEPKHNWLQLWHAQTLYLPTFKLKEISLSAAVDEIKHSWSFLAATKYHLICFRGDPDKCDFFGNTALHHAAINGYMPCVTFLVNFGANVWLLDNDMQTALDHAAMRQHDDIVAYLDSVYSRQMHLSGRMVQKMRERAAIQARKRAHRYREMQNKAEKRAERASQEQNVNGSQVRNGLSCWNPMFDVYLFQTTRSKKSNGGTLSRLFRWQHDNTLFHKQKDVLGAFRLQHFSISLGGRSKLGR